MTWVFPAFLVATVLHMVEEYAFPGGFMDMTPAPPAGAGVKRLNPRFAPLITTPFAVIVNGLQLVLCVCAILVGSSYPAFSLSIASLVFINGWVHIGACFRVKGYAPGAITGAFLYLPLGFYAYYAFSESGHLSLAQAAISGILGIIFQLVPIAYFALGTMRRA